MGFTYNNLNYDIVNLQESNIQTPLHRQNAMTIYDIIKPNILGMKEYTDDFTNEPYIGYLILSKVNNEMEWVKVDVQKGEEIINNII